jgi:hypothetical protein
MAANSPEHNAHRRARRANPETWPFIALAQIKYRAKRDGLACTITAADLKVPAICPVLSIPLEPGTKCKPNSPSVDRRDNTKGYIPGNVCVISHRANQLKGDASVLDMVCVLEYMTGRR